MPYVDFRAIKARVSIHDVLDHYDIITQLKRTGETLTGKCPIHQGDRSDSFRVSLDKNCFNCFSCKAHGNQLDLVVALESCNVKEAAEKLIEWFALEDSPRPSQPRGNPTVAAPPSSDARRTTTVARTTPCASDVPRPIEPVVNKPLGFSLAEKLDQTHPYLKERGLDAATIREFGVGLCNAGTMIGRIAIPLHNGRGELIGYVGRWPGEPPKETPKYKLPKGFKKSAELFNLNRAKAESSETPLVIVEGFFDVMHLWQLGQRRVVALMGSSLSEAQESLIREHAAGGRILVMLDQDDAGRSGRDDLVLRLARFAYVKAHASQEEGFQPERLTAEELAEAVQ